MIKSNIISKQAHMPIVVLLILFVILKLFISSFLANIILFAAFFIAFIYRDPSRHIFENSNSILSPIDAKVIAIDYVNGKQKIYCKINFCNTHVVRAPQNGEMKIKKQQHGLNLDPNSYKAKKLNEQVTIKFNHLKLKLISGICNPKINIIEDRYVNQGDKIGLFLEGMAILSVKNDYTLSIKIGDKLISGQTILFKDNFNIS
jgi:phosphatidylserine decarboxylase